MNSLESDARRDWKLYAPVEQGKVRQIQKRFYSVMGQIQQLRRKTLSRHGDLKRGLVEQAQQLQELDNHQEAMTRAKALQAEWKQVGPAAFKDERKLWEAFRAA